MKNEIDGLSSEKYIELTARIAAGLLASGHFTESHEESGKPWTKYNGTEKEFWVVLEAEEILDSIVTRHNEVQRMIDEEKG